MSSIYSENYQKDSPSTALKNMRQSRIYVIVTSCLTSVLVLFIVTQPKCSNDELENFASSGPLISDGDILRNENTLPDISSLISSQPYYNKLCEQDRYTIF